jgi:hypothetical protein
MTEHITPDPNATPTERVDVIVLEDSVDADGSFVAFEVWTSDDALWVRDGVTGAESTKKPLYKASRDDVADHVRTCVLEVMAQDD